MSDASRENDFVRQPLCRVESPDHRLRAEWAISPNPARLHQKVELTLDITHTLDLELVPLEFGETLGDFTVWDVVVSMPKIVEQRENHRWTIGLTPHAVGTCRIGAIPILCENRTSETAFPAADSLSILIPPQEATIFAAATSAAPLQLHQATGPRAVHDYAGYYWGLGLLLLLLALAGLFRLRRSRRTLPPAAPPAPGRIAMKKLASLLDRRLHERDVKTFYIEITTIVRWFIEQVTEIRAPELTTEEFLKEIQRMADQNAANAALSKRPAQTASTTTTKLKAVNPNLVTLAEATRRHRIRQAALITSEVPVIPDESAAATESDAKVEPPSDEWSTFFSERNRAALAAFLEIADLVKFARLQPTREEIMLGFRRASELIELGRPLEATSLSARRSG